MRMYKVIFFLIIANLNLSCSSDDESMEEEMTTTCTEEISFEKDGTLVTLPIISLINEPAAIFQLKDPSPFNPDGVSRALGLRLQSGLTVFDIVLELNVDGPDSCIPIGVYNTESLDTSDGLLSFAYFNAPESFLVGLGVGSGTLEITKCDFENKLISGRFFATLGQGFGPDMLVISNGVFEDVCLEE